MSAEETSIVIGSKLITTTDFLAKFESNRVVKSDRNAHKVPKVPNLIKTIIFQQFLSKLTLFKAEKWVLD